MKRWMRLFDDNGPIRRIRWIGPTSPMLLIALLAACTPPIKQYEMREQSISCDEANRFTYDTLVSMGYGITSFEPASPSRPGKARASRKNPVSGGREPVTVLIACRAGGVDIDASEDGKLLGQIDFKRAFHITFSSVRSMATARAEQEKRQAAGTAESQQRTDLNVRIEPIHGQASRLDFDFDLSAAGVLPVRIRIQNPTGRFYSLEPGEIRLTRTDRERVAALGVEDVARRMAAARTPQGEPATSMGEAQIAERLRSRLFTTSSVAPRSDNSGFLFFPAGQYQRGRVVLTEKESGETEGFAVEF